MKNVLMLTYAYYPLFNGGVPRVAKFCKYLSRYGWNPILVCADFRSSEYGQTTLENDNCEVIRVVDRGTACDRWSRVRKSLYSFKYNLNDLKFINLERDMLIAVDKICQEKQIDVIFASSFPQFIHRIAYRVSNKHHIPWIADHRDIVGQTNEDYDKMSHLWRLFLPIQRIFEIHRDNIYDRSASTIITVSQGLADILEHRTGKPVDVIMNGYDPEDYNISEPKHNNSKFKIVYTGSLFGDRNTNIFFDGVDAILEKNTEYAEALSIEFYGDCCKEINTRLQRNSELLRSIVMLKGSVPAEEAKRIQYNADILYLISSRAKGIATGKLFEYLATQNTIISIPGDDDISDRIIRECGAGEIFENVESFSYFLEKKIGEWKKNGRLKTNYNTKEVEKYSRVNETKQLSQVFDRYCSR